MGAHAPEKILVVEDDRNISKALKYNLEKEGYRVLSASDGVEGLELFRKESPSLVVLDVMIPKLNGFDFCKSVRVKSTVPILMLTAKKDEVDRVLGLELGADDYVTKPFSLREVLVRVKNILRRTTPSAVRDEAAFKAGTLEVDFERYETRIKGKVVPLSPKEFEFLRCLISAQGKALTREQILEKVWGYERSMEISTNTIDQHVARLRDRLGSEAARVVTVKNVGYRLKHD